MVWLHTCLDSLFSTQLCLEQPRAPRKNFAQSPFNQWPVCLTIPGHAEGQAFLKAAVLTAVPVDSVDDTVLVAGTLVVHWARLGATEKALQSSPSPIHHKCGSAYYISTASVHQTTTYLHVTSDLSSKVTDASWSITQNLCGSWLRQA